MEVLEVEKKLNLGRIGYKTIWFITNFIEALTYAGEKILEWINKRMAKARVWARRKWDT